MINIFVHVSQIYGTGENILDPAQFKILSWPEETEQPNAQGFLC